MVVLVTFQNGEDPFKNEGARVVTTFLPLKVYGDFSRCSRAAYPKSEIGSGRNSNSSKLIWLSLLPAKMKKIQSKMKVLEWSQHYTLISKTLKGS